MTALPTLARAQAEGLADVSLLEQLSLEQLMNVEVTSVSKKEENRSEAPAAISVITAEDIRQFGIRTVPDALRLAAGTHVGRVSSSQWAVSTRGFSGLNSSKLLVLIDGRSVYTPLFSGVFWDVQDTLLADIARIEVIRGPGASLWGANAMNGVINIVTKSSAETQGTYAEAGGGTHERGFGSVRYGGAIGEAATYRVYAKYFNRAGTALPAENPNSDDWSMARFGFRSDWDATEVDSFVLQGDVYTGDVGQPAPSIAVTGRAGPPPPLRGFLNGGNIIAAWKRQLAEDSDFALRFYYDRTRRNDPSYLDVLDTYDVDFQNRVPLPLNQELLWGLNFRLMVNENRGKGILELSRPEAADRLYSGFVQDQITFEEPALRFTFGSKFEHNSFSGFEIQPTGRFAWQPTAGHTLWGAVSRAVRVPTRIERDINVVAADPASDPLPILIGNPKLDSEKLDSYELGYRLPILPVLYVDLAAFYNHYTDLMTLEAGTPSSDSAGKVTIPISNRNQMNGHARGFELAAAYEPTPGNWKLTGTYTFFKLQLSPTGLDINRNRLFQGATPAHQFTVGFQKPLTHRLELGAFFRWIGNLESSGDLGNQGVPEYASLDARVAWRLTKEVDIAVVGQNLLHSTQSEFPGFNSRVERGAYGMLSARF